ncbi:MAG TPA: substrate-binding domain-containing protein [Polyangiaceae bacterium]|nr:substrate-binding domain-containing protein [Polyangiaceae bacterium]
MTARTRRRIAFVTDSLFGAYQSELRKAFERAALRRGLDVVTVIGRGLGHADPAERAQNVLYDWLTPRSVDGAVLLSSTLMNFLGSGPLEGLVARLGTLPKVSIGATLQRVPSITVDNRAGMRAAVDHLIEVHGCRRMGYLAGPNDNPECRARLEGYRYALEAHFLPYDPKLVQHSAFTIDGGALAMQMLLERGRVFDAIVAANDAMAVGALQVLGARRLPVPERMRVIAFDDSPVAVSALLSSVAQPFNQLALHALDALEGAMTGRSVREIAFWPRLALRDSCGCGDTDLVAQLPALSRGQKLGDYLAAQRTPLAELLQELNAACFDWWSTRSERLLRGVEAAVAGDERQFSLTLDQLVAEAFEDGVPVEQIGRSLARLQRHLQSAPEMRALGAVWSRALARLTSALGKMERKHRMEAVARAAALRDAALGLWGVERERQLAERLAEALTRMGVRPAYLGLLGGAQRERVTPCLQIDASGGLRWDGPSYPVQQLLPEGFPGLEGPSTLLVSVVNFGPHVSGIWACNGRADVFAFEQLRTEISAVLQLLALRRALELDPPAVPAPLRASEAPPAPTPPDPDALERRSSAPGPARNPERA